MRLRSLSVPGVALLSITASSTALLLPASTDSGDAPLPPSCLVGCISAQSAGTSTHVCSPEYVEDIGRCIESNCDQQEHAYVHAGLTTFCQAYTHSAAQNATDAADNHNSPSSSSAPSTPELSIDEHHEQSHSHIHNHAHAHAHIHHHGSAFRHGHGHHHHHHAAYHHAQHQTAAHATSPTGIVQQPLAPAEPAATARSLPEEQHQSAPRATAAAMHTSGSEGGPRRPAGVFGLVVACLAFGVALLL